MNKRQIKKLCSLRTPWQMARALRVGDAVTQPALYARIHHLREKLVVVGGYQFVWLRVQGILALAKVDKPYRMDDPTGWLEPSEVSVDDNELRRERRYGAITWEVENDKNM